MEFFDGLLPAGPPLGTSYEVILPPHLTARVPQLSDKTSVWVNLLLAGFQPPPPIPYPTASAACIYQKCPNYLMPSKEGWGPWTVELRLLVNRDLSGLGGSFCHGRGRSSKHQPRSPHSSTPNHYPKGHEACSSESSQPDSLLSRFVSRVH